MSAFIETADLEQVHNSIRSALRTWRRFVVAVDGVDGAGKSTFARYLAWQLAMPAVETDLFLDQDLGGLNYRFDHLKLVIENRLSSKRPVIIEGVRLLLLLNKLDVSYDFLVWVEQEDHDGSHALSGALSEYTGQFAPRERANAIFRWRPQEPLDNGGS